MKTVRDIYKPVEHFVEDEEAHDHGLTLCGEIIRGLWTFSPDAPVDCERCLEKAP